MKNVLFTLIITMSFVAAKAQRVMKLSYSDSIILNNLAIDCSQWAIIDCAPGEASMHGYVKEIKGHSYFCHDSIGISKCVCDSSLEALVPKPRFNDERIKTLDKCYFVSFLVKGKDGF